MKSRKKKIGMMLACLCAGSFILANPGQVYADESKLAEAEPYQDFSSDRSTWFFASETDRSKGGKVVFADFFSPFDPYTKVKTYDPLVKHELDGVYSIKDTEDGKVLFMELADLEKLYDPYFSYEYDEAAGKLNIRYVLYEKLEIDGFGARGTKLLYYKHVWDMSLNVEDGKASVGSVSYKTYDPALGGRNIGDFTIDASTEKAEVYEIELKNEVVIESDKVTVPASEIMSYMGKKCSISDGYFQMQTEGLVDVTESRTLEERQPLTEEYVSGFDPKDWEGLVIPEVVVPDASNTWHCGTYEELDKDYTWADYMDDVVSGKRDYGWLWNSFYLSSDDTYVDLNGEEVSCTADRIVPVNLYVPKNYDSQTSRLVYMLHGGTGNENTATYRLMIRDQNVTEVDRIAEEYNYVIVSPNGWTQNPMWREKQAFNSFNRAVEMAETLYPVQEERVFLTGNSMGGKGTLEIAMRMPEKFTAIAATAPKIAEQVTVGGKKTTICNIEDSSVYSVEKNLADMPTMIVQGNVDTTTSYKVQIGGPTVDGMITNHLLPYLNNVTAVEVESGNHSYSYGAVLEPIFDFFEKQLNPDEDNYDFRTLKINVNKLDKVYLDTQEYELKVPAKMSGDTVMVSIRDLAEIYGEDFRCYFIKNYNEDPAKMRYYYTAIHNNQVINFMTEATANPLTDSGDKLLLYRRNLERYMEDGVRMDSFKVNPEPLEDQPVFSAAPFEENGEIYVPLKEVMAVLKEDVEVVDEPETEPETEKETEKETEQTTEAETENKTEETTAAEKESENTTAAAEETSQTNENSSHTEGESPDTGDSQSFGIYLAGMFLAACAVTGLVIAKKRLQNR